jgi:hypothetical protein
MPHFVKGYGDPEELPTYPMPQPKDVRTVVKLAWVRLLQREP